MIQFHDLIELNTEFICDFKEGASFGHRIQGVNGVKLPGKERQCCIVSAGKVIPETTSSVQRWFFQFNIDGFPDSCLKPSVFSVQNV